MKRYILFFMAALLSMLSGIPVNAQQTQDAFYIYRNDGNFNGFFFADIDHIEYSKTDTLGIAHDDYVVQEVYTLDSIYRIPISAIDSVAFVTPETKYKSDVKFTTGNEIWNYVIASDSIKTLMLDPGTPASLIPQAGDKLVTIDSYPLLPGGFYGKVQAVSDAGVGIIVNCEIPELTELFERHVVKVSAIGEDASQARTRRNENSTVTDFDLPGKSVDMNLTDAGYKINDNFSITGEGKLSYGYAPHAHVRAFVAVDTWTGVNVDATMRVETTTWFDLGIKGGISGQFDIELAKKKIWIPKTPFFIDQIGGFSSSCTGEVELKVHRKNVSSSTAVLQYNSSLFDSGPKMCGASFRNLDAEENTEVTGKVTITAGPYYSVALTLIDKKISGIGMRFDAGAKLEVEAEVKWDDLVLTSPALLTGYMLLNPTAQYDLLDRDGSVKIGPYITGKVTIEVAQKWTKDFKFLDLATPWGFDGGLVPHFSDVDVMFDDETHAPVATANLSRKTLFPCPLGFVRYYTKSGRRVGETSWVNFKYWKEDPEAYNLMLKPSGGGLEVTLYPTTRLLDYELLASPSYTYTQPEFMEVSPNSLEFDEKGGTQSITVTDNLDRNEEVYFRDAAITTDEKDGKWIDGTWSGNVYQVTTTANNTGMDRQASIEIEVYDEPRTVNMKHTVSVTQKSGELENLIIDPLTITLPGYSKEFKDGQLASSVTVKYPKISQDIRVIPSEEPWFKVDPDWSSTTTDDLYNICTRKFYVTPNTSFSNSRQASIAFEVINADNTLTTRSFTVKQEPMEASIELSPTEILLSADNPDEPGYSDTKIITIMSNLLDPDFIQYVKDQKWSSSGDWIEAEILDGTIVVRALANPSEDPRVCSLNYVITTTSGDEKNAAVQITQQGKVYVPPFTISPEDIHFDIKGGDITVSILGDNVDHIKEINCYGSIWLGGGGMNKSFTLTAKDNTGQPERYATFGITVQMTDGTLQTQQFIAYQDGISDVPEPGDIKTLNFAFTGKGSAPDIEEGAIRELAMGFNFKADNSTFKVTTTGNISHYECQGHEVTTSQDNSATLSFDIDNVEMTVKNLQFHFVGKQTMDMTVPGVASSHTIFDTESSTSLGDFPIKTYYDSYKGTEVEVSEGLQVKSFSIVVDSYTTYSDNEIEPVSTHTVYTYADDPLNKVYLYINYK